MTKHSMFTNVPVDIKQNLCFAEVVAIERQFSQNKTNFLLFTKLRC